MQVVGRIELQLQGRNVVDCGLLGEWSESLSVEEVEFLACKGPYFEDQKELSVPRRALAGLRLVLSEAICAAREAAAAQQEAVLKERLAR